MSDRHVLTVVEDGILTITLNRPEKLNAYTERMGHELSEALEQANEDDDIRVVIVTGAGRGFCAGADMSADTGWFNDPTVKQRRGNEGGFAMRIYECLKPVIAAINGPAVGVGVTMTLPMDIRIAADTAKFGMLFTRRGLVPEAGSAWFLPRIVGLPQALQWVLTGEMIEAPEALRAGLVSELVPVEQVLPRAREIARKIADNTSPVATAVSRQLLWRTSAADHPMAALGIDARLIQQLAKGADLKEGIAAFQEKRQPAFTSRPSTDMPEGFPWW